MLSLCRASSVGATVFADKIPVAPEVQALATRMGIPAYRFAFPIGGDFQFLVTAPPSHSSHMRTLGFASIGRIIEGPTVSLVTSAGDILTLPGEGHRDIRGLSFLDEVKHLLREDSDQ